MTEDNDLPKLERYDVPIDRELRPIAERVQAQEILPGAGWRVTDIMSRPQNSSPDCEGVFDGKPCGIEVTELLDSEVQEKVRFLRNQGDFCHVSRTWTSPELIEALQRRIDVKHAKIANWRDGERYASRFLVIHTDEFNLTSEFVQRAVADHRFKGHDFTGVAFGLSYRDTTPRFFRLALHAGGLGCPP